MDGIDLVAVADPERISRDEASRRVATASGLMITARCSSAWTPPASSFPLRFIAASPATFLSRSIPVCSSRSRWLLRWKTALRSLNLAAEHRIPLQVGHIERFNPAFQELAGLAGSPRYIRAERVSPYAFRSMDIGVVHDLMIHDIDLVLRLTGSTVKHVDAFGICIVGGQEDCVQARLTFENGCRADLVANRVSPAASRKLQTWSETGCVDADLHQRRVVAFQPGEALLRRYPSV